MKVKERFLRYAATDTASEPDFPETPSTAKQRVLRKCFATSCAAWARRM